jgi:polyhydroxyalkanoate synthase
MSSSAAQLSPFQAMADLTQSTITTMGQAGVPIPATLAPTQAMLAAFAATTEALQKDPHALLRQTLNYHQQQLALYASMLEKAMGREVAAVITPSKDDRRFGHESWQLPFFDLLKQSYLLASNYVTDVVTEAKGLDPQQKMQADFYTRQFVELLSPSNLLLTNPEALSTAMATQGESLLNGMKNLLEDLQQGKISMVDKKPFVVGETIAVTQGEVVLRNRICEVIQYQPTTAKVHKTPLVICPPWINRFYVLDLQPQTSLVKYLVDQGFQVFMVSWKNPDASYKDVGFEDYMKEGFVPAVNCANSICGTEQANVVGYCIGGTMVFAALAALQSKFGSAAKSPIKSATFLTTLSDFANAGELKVFTDDAQVAALEAKMAKDGVLDGKDMASTFSLLRANDLVWNFVVSNYLLGKQPMPFDILVWNDDSTRMPAAMHSWYLRKLYVENALAKPNAVTLLGEKIDLSKLEYPMYMLSALNDHITPWESCFAPYAKMASTNKRMAVTKAGHVAGVVSPPTPAGKPIKRTFWVGEIGKGPNGESPEAKAWLKTATETPDSWWPDYATWLSGQSDEQIAAPKAQGNKAYKPLCAAPGVYVKEK